jgi:hypothetical protein
LTFDPKLALKKLREDYDWRGPGGKAQRHLVIPRKLARIILDAAEPNNPTAEDPIDDAQSD